MKRTFILLTLAVSSVALSACFSSSKGNTGGLAVVNATPNFAAKPVKGMTEDVSMPVHTTGMQGNTFEDVNDNRLKLTFTSTEELVISDSADNEIARLGAADVHHSFEQMGVDKLMHTYSSFLSDGHRQADPADRTDVTIFTGKAENAPEYAIMRISTDTDVHWALVGEATSTPLSGQATYDGGYYMMHSTDGAKTAQGKMNIAADFDTSTLGFTLHSPDGIDPATLFGADKVEFVADLVGGNYVRTLDSSGVVTGATDVTTLGSNYDKATVWGLMGDSGNSSAGLVTLTNTGDATDAFYGGYHAVKQ